MARTRATQQTASPAASSPTVVDAGTLAAGEKTADPQGEVVLTVSGDIGEHNKGKRLGCQDGQPAGSLSEVV